MTSKVYKRRPRLPPFLLVESVGIGVTSSAKKCLELGTAMQKAEPTHASTIWCNNCSAKALIGRWGSCHTRSKPALPMRPILMPDRAKARNAL